jgi:Zn-finger nucleic acid-binding protein
VLEGELHHFDCDMERCPFCGGQLLSCGCCYKILGIDTSPGTWAYENGLTKEQEDEWKRRLEKMGRVPYVVYPNMCARCGRLWPEMFNIPNEEWAKYVPLSKRSCMLCIDCYNHVKHLIDTHAKVNC